MSADGSVEHTGDTSPVSGDDEQVKVNLATVPADGTRSFGLDLRRREPPAVFGQVFSVIGE